MALACDYGQKESEQIDLDLCILLTHSRSLGLSVMMTDQPSIHGYTLREQLYAGTRTVVYRALCEEDGTSVVIKILRSPHETSEELARFRNEFVIATKLRTPGMIAPKAFVTLRQGYGLVMEDVGGVSLRDFLRSQSNMPIETVLEIGLQLADCLLALGKQKIIHKDINPANILIHPDTHQVWLIDFSLASILPWTSQAQNSPCVLEGTLAYISPEQTGRMSHGIDYRSDFYSLGATLYELLTGEQPFQSDDPMELIHCHIAKMPVPPHRTVFLAQSIPIPLSKIILKLMAKNAGDRYQSALGLRHDLRHCRDQWLRFGQIAEFVLGQRDVCDRFLIPAKLYGREAEVQTLLNAYQRVSQGTSELLLVAGYSGVGKTAIVREVQRNITQTKGYFIQGKFDQFNCNTPFLAFLQAVRRLIGQILCESTIALEQWKSRILDAVGRQGQVLIEVIPDLALIIGPQPPVPELSGIAAQHRFNRLFRRLIHVFANSTHPLTIFLDDLQWIDSASLGLLRLLITQAETPYLLVIGAYRDNEVSRSHPLMLILQGLGHQDVRTLALEPLVEDDIHQLVAESLHCSVATGAPLATLVYQKTQGNPFFATQFLQGLHSDGWITFNADLGHWQCDLSQVRCLALTDDVVDFMLWRLQQWPDTTQQVLAIAACLGHQFDLNDLSIVCEQSPEALAQELWLALQSGLVIPETETYNFSRQSETDSTLTPSEDVTVTYRFLHDRVQQAAYAIIPANEQGQVHTRIGQFLLTHLPAEKQEAAIFDIVNQLNRGRDLLSSADERHSLLGLNLRAGMKAQAATAYRVALDYFDIALELLSDHSWEQNYALTLDVYEQAAESAALAGEGDRMEALMQVVLVHAKTPLDTAKTLQVKMQYCLGQNQPLSSIEIARRLLKDLGIILPEFPTMQDVQRSQETCKQRSAPLSFDEIVALPVLTDPKKLAIINTLILVVTPLMIVDPTSFLLTVLIAVQFSLEHGNSPAMAYGYALYAILIKNLDQDVDLAYEWGNMAMRLLNTLSPQILENRVYHTVSAFITHEKRHVEETLKVFDQAFGNGVDNGDYEFSGYSIYLNCYNRFFLGQNLSLVKQDIIKTSRALSSIGQNLPVSWTQCFDQLIVQLTGSEDDSLLLGGDRFDAERYVTAKQSQKDSFGLCYFYFNQAIARYLVGDYQQAKDASTSARQYLSGLAGMLTEVIFYFYDSLIWLACDERNDPRVRAHIRDNQQQMKHWANNAPMNFKHKYELVCAEEKRLSGDRLAAMDYYDSAIAGAKDNRYLQEEALANELAAKFYLDWGKPKIASVYMQDAYRAYDRWGANTKTQDLESRYLDLLQPVLRPANASDILNTLDHSSKGHLSIHSSFSRDDKAPIDLNISLDLTSVLQSAQALSESLDLNELLENLAPIMLQSSGSEKLALLLPNSDSDWQVRVLATKEQTQLTSTPLSTYSHLPIQLIQYVQRTQEILVLNGLPSSFPLRDPYLDENPHYCILCLPLLHQNELKALLYLEHRSVLGVFTRDRITILNFLGTQAAISLENALLNQRLEQKLALQTLKRQESETRFRHMVDNLPGVVYQARTTPDGIVSFPYISHDCYALYEVSAESIMSQEYNLRDFEHPDDQQMLDQLLHEMSQSFLQDSDRTWEQDFRIIPPLGVVKWVHLCARAMAQSDGSTLWDGILIDVSDRKLTELALKDSQSRLHYLTENVPGLFFSYVLHPDGSNEFTYVSAYARELYEMEPDAILHHKQSPWDRVHPDDVDDLAAKIQESAQTLEPITVEHRFIVPEKGLRWGQNIGCPRRLDNGDIVWHGMSFDITERKATELALHDAQAQFRHMTENVPGMIFRYVLHPDGRDALTYVNSQIRDIFELEPETALENTEMMWSRIHPDDIPRISQYIQSSAETLDPFTTAYRLILPEKGIRWVQNMTRAERLENGDVVWDGVVVDITERIEAEEKLQAVSDRLELALNSAQIGIWEWNFQDQHLSWDERMFQIYQVSPATFRGTHQDWEQCVHPDDLGGAQQNENEAFSPLKEFRIICPDGSIRHIVSSVILQCDNQGQPIRAVGTNIDISDRKNIELALEQEILRRNTIFNASPDAIHILDTQGQLLEANANFYQTLGYTAEEARHLNVFDWEAKYTPEDLAAMYAAPRSVLANLSICEETLHRRKDGSIFPVDLSVRAMEWDGQISLISIARDITDRKAAEAALRNSQSQLQRLAANVPAMIFRYSLHPDGSDEIFFVTQRSREIFELEPQDIMQDNSKFWALVHPDDLDATLEKAKVSARDLSPYQDEYRIIMPDGRVKWIEIASRPEQQDNGSIIWDGVCFDMSDRKRTELALEQEVLRRRTVFNASSDGIYILDLEGNLIEANDSFLNQLGYTREESHGLHVGDWDVKVPLAQILATLQTYLPEANNVRVVETIHQRKDQTTFPVEISICAMDWRDEITFVCISRDISERKQAEENLQQTNEELIRATRLKDEFLANMSHELRTPLNSILGLTEGLQDQVFGPLNPKQSKYLHTIERSGKHLLQLINDILDVAKIESGQLEFEPRPTNMQHLCKSGLSFVKQQAVQKGIRLSIKLPSQKLILELDERRVLQAIVNLLNNAVKFTPQTGRITLEVSYHHGMNRNDIQDSQAVLSNSPDRDSSRWQSGTLTSENYVTISITDTGIGISPQDISKLFKPFSQIDSALNRKYSGTGLGLMLVKQIAELHGGIVDLASTVGVGSRFSIKLPCEMIQPEVATVNTSNSVPSLPRQTGAMQNKLVLLAEDNIDNIEMMLPYLEDEGYRVVIAQNGYEAIKLTQQHNPTLILMDIQMPELDGLAAIRQIRDIEGYQGIPIIALTALAMKGDRERCLGAGADEYISKPVRMKALLESIRTLITDRMNYR